ncbi:MAG: hypothetical protein AVDCRST_MAG77-2788 [uncultured Chloroflexi bacterium]|uniref:histidine kinase n=1 Tax=uncultured Chloroflexota bacterium TaxID=166587 RepID=A0A6J4IY40_9CHLR|nr:MAG: hypothetical protein AVDCRST_MAG77-2788 [uncultured Chloroflexota bacterium]
MEVPMEGQTQAPRRGGASVPGEREHEQRRMQALAAVAQAVARVDTPEEWGARVVEAVERASGWSRVFVFRIEPDCLRLVAARGITPEQEAASQRLVLPGTSLGAQAVTRREPVIVGRSEIGETAVSNMRALGTPSFASFPLIARDRVFGTLTLLDVRAREVADEEVEFLQAVADTLATGLESAELFTAAQAAARARDDFLSVASHELRTPLTPLKGLAQSLLRQIERSRAAGRPVDMDRIERYLRTMEGQVDRLATLVNDLLDVSRIRTGRLELRLAEVDLVALTAATLDRFDAVARVDRAGGLPGLSGAPEAGSEGSGGGTTGVSGAGGVPAEVDGGRDGAASEAPIHVLRFRPRVERLVGQWDAGRLEQVITNLIANSLKYTPAGGDVVVEIWRDNGTGDGDSGTVGTRGTGESNGDARAQAHLSVHDTGIGIPPEQLDQLFKPFHRLENAPPEHFGGMGLGLYITHDMVTRHGGRIWAESAGAGQGTTFHVTLPMAQPH